MKAGTVTGKAYFVIKYHTARSYASTKVHFAICRTCQPEYPAHLRVGDLVPLDRVGQLKALQRLVVLLEVQVAHALVVPDLPVLRVELLGLLEDVQGGLVLAQQVQRPAHLLHVVHVHGVQVQRRLERCQRFFDAALVPQN